MAEWLSRFGAKKAANSQERAPAKAHTSILKEKRAASAEDYQMNKNAAKMDKKTLDERIKAAKEGDQRAFSALLDEFWQDVYNFQLKRVGNEGDAEDITIQTFARAFDKIHNFDPAYSFKTWLITISKNIHIDMLRRQDSVFLHSTSEEKEAKTIADDTPSIEDSLIMEQQFNNLLYCIKQLKDPYRTAIQLRYLHEKSYKEIAEEMQTSLSNVKITLLRAKKILAELLKR